MSEEISVIRDMVAEVKALIAQTEACKGDQQKTKQLIAELSPKIEKLVSFKKTANSNDDNEMQELKVKIEELQNSFILLEARESSDSDSFEVERQEIDIPDDARSNGSSLLESTDDGGDQTDQKSAQSDFLQSLIIAVVFCLIFAILWSYLT